MQQQARYTRPSQTTNARPVVGGQIRPGHPAPTPASVLHATRQAQCSSRPVGKRLWQVASASQNIATSSTEVVSQTASEVVKADLPYTEHKWLWRGHTINYVTAGCGNPVLLVHGFGLSSSHYRKTIKELSKSYKVYAIDLLGFGKSSKPRLQYTMELWRDLVIDFLAEFTSGRSTTVVGNSIGALVCLMVAADAPPDVVRGVVLLNSAGAMNNKGVLGDWRIVLLYPLFLFIDFLLSIPQVAAAIFKNLSTKENIKQALRQVYSNKDAVTDELVDLIHAPSLDPNARDVFISVITGPPGPNPFKLIPRIHVPILTLWGDQDTLTPSDGPLGKFFKELPSKRPNTTYKFLNGVGHCLHDDMPELVHAELLPWLRELHTGSATDCVVGQPPAQMAEAVTTTGTIGMADEVMP